MIELRTLGVLELRQNGGQPALLSQPKRAALLVYLAVARPCGFHRRDKLLGMFWPELDERHARGALSQALSHLRQTLGPDAILTRGTEDVAINPARVVCDATELDARLEAGDRRRAVALYGGDFLPGFHLSALPDFERWVEDTRARLRDQVCRMAAALADESVKRGDGAEAVEWLRRALSLAPHDEAILRKLMGLMDSLGDRAGALTVHQQFVARLAADLDVDPTPETERLADAVRRRAAEASMSSGSETRESVSPRGMVGDARPATRAPTPDDQSEAGGRRRSQKWAAVGVAGALAIALAWSLWDPLVRRSIGGSPAPARYTPRVVVADFDGPPDDPELAVTARELISNALDGSRVVRTLPRLDIARGLRLAHRAETTRVGADLARELAERSSISAVVAGRIARVGDRYAISVKVVDTDSGHTVLPVDVVADGVNDFLPGVGRAANLLVAGLGRLGGGIRRVRPSYQVSTPSLEAYRLFRKADSVGLMGSAMAANAIALAREALAIDPEFAWAWYRVGLSFSILGFNDSALVALAQARRFEHRLNEIERLRLAGLMAEKRGDLDVALDAYDRILSIDPDNMVAHNNRGLLLMRRQRYDEAVHGLRGAIDRAPFGAAPVNTLNLSNLLMCLGRFDEARSHVDSAPPLQARFQRLWLTLADNDWARTELVAREILDNPNHSLIGNKAGMFLGLAASFAARGALTRADSVLQAGIAELASRDSARVARSQLNRLRRARLLLATAAGRDPPEALPITPAMTRGTLLTNGLLAAARKDSLGAREALRRLQSFPATGLDELGVGPDLIAAWLESNKERWDEVIDLLGTRTSTYQYGFSLEDTNMWTLAQWLVVDAHTRADQPAEAIAHLELLLDFRFGCRADEEQERGLIFALATARLVRAYAGIGRHDDALRHWAVLEAQTTLADAQTTRILAETKEVLNATSFFPRGG